MATLNELLIKARQATMSDAERETQRLSFAYGNTNFENPMITRNIVRRAAEELRHSRRSGTATRTMRDAGRPDLS